MTDTTNLGLHRPAAGDASWDGPLNANADTLDAQFAATGTAHSHNGTAGKGPKLAQANTHESPDTDVGASSLHHTLGTGAGQAAAGNDSRLSNARTPTAHHTTHSTGGTDAIAPADIGAEPALGNPGTDGYVLSSTAAGVRSWAAPGTGGGGDPASATHAATSKTTPVDADELPLADSAASYALKKLTWANLKATLKGYFDGLYAAVTHTHAAADVASGTLATARLGSGTADATTYLRGDQTWATVSGGSSGAWTKIGETALTGTAASISFTSIPGTYRALRLVGAARADAGVTVTTSLIRFNGDTTAIYDQQNLFGGNTSATASQTIGGTAITSLVVPAALAPSTIAALFTVDVPLYAGTTFGKGLFIQQIDKRSTSGTDYFVSLISGYWRSAAAITSLSLAPASGNFVAGTTIALYGLT